MSLGTNLESDIKLAITNSDNASDFSGKFSTAVNNYLSGAEYAEGSGTYTSTLPSNLFLLPTAGTASLAATQIANGVQSYYGTGTVVAGIGSASQGGVSVVQCTITANLVASSLQPLLLDVFNLVSDSKTPEQITMCKGPLLVQKTAIEVRIAELQAIPSPTPEEEAELIDKLEELDEVNYQISECEAQQSSSDYKAGAIADAIETAIATITTAHTELAANGATLGPFIGGIE